MLATQGFSFVEDLLLYAVSSLLFAALRRGRSRDALLALSILMRLLSEQRDRDVVRIDDG